MKMTPFTVCLTLMFGLCQGKIWEIPLPTEIQDCYNTVQNADIQKYVGSKISWLCDSKVIGSHINNSVPIDAQHISYYTHLLENAIPYLPGNTDGKTVPRRKRQVNPPPCVRREYRVLSDEERGFFHGALNVLKNDTTLPPNRYDAIALLHEAAVQRAHFGAAFAGWHRLYLLMFEAALQEVDPSVCLPYWDTTLDNELEDPTMSSVWTPAFFGTPNGPVVHGPFANWITPHGAQLIRNVGVDGELLSATAMQGIISRRRYEDITSSQQVRPEFSLELHHGGIHMFCGGTLTQLNTAAFDPIFFLLHAFVDCIWEVFRGNLRARGVDPQQYPDIVTPDSPHHSSAPTGFGDLRQVDGYSNAIAERFVYHLPPVCSSSSPQCGSRYLTCLVRIGRCVPITAAAAMSLQPNPADSQDPVSLGQEPIEPVSSQVLVSPGRKLLGRANSQGPVSPGSKLLDPANSQGPVSPGSKLLDPANSQGPVSPGSQLHGPDTNKGPVFPDSQPPGHVGADTSCLRQETFYDQAIQNDFCSDNTCDSNEWAMIPVGIISVRPPNFKTYHSYPVHNGRVDRHDDIYSPRAYAHTYKFITKRMSNPMTYERCKGNSAGQVLLSSRGINYHGFYEESAVVDQHLAVSMAVGFVAVKKPTGAGVSTALIRVHDSCGRECQAACKDALTGKYKECKGAIAVSSDQPLMYGTNYDEAVMNVFDYDFNLPQFKTENIFLTFHCEYHNKFPYTDYTNGVVPHPPVEVEPPVVAPSNTAYRRCPPGGCLNSQNNTHKSIKTGGNPDRDFISSTRQKVEPPVVVQPSNTAYRRCPPGGCLNSQNNTHNSIKTGGGSPDRGVSSSKRHLYSSTFLISVFKKIFG